MLRTNKDVHMVLFGFEFTVPKGTRVTHETAAGYDENYNFIDDLSWIPKINGIANKMLMHDANYYGIEVNKEDVTDEAL